MGSRQRGECRSAGWGPGSSPPAARAQHRARRLAGLCRSGHFQPNKSCGSRVEAPVGAPLTPARPSVFPRRPFGRFPPAPASLPAGARSGGRAGPVFVNSCEL